MLILHILFSAAVRAKLCIKMIPLRVIRYKSDLKVQFQLIVSVEIQIKLLLF